MCKFLVFLAVLSLSGCAVCEQHPIACGVAGGVLVTSVALSLHHDDRASEFDRTAHGQPCSGGSQCRP